MSHERLTRLAQSQASTDKLRVCYVLDNFPKISETFVRDEVEWMASHGYLDRVFSLAEESAAWAEISAHVRVRTRITKASENHANSLYAHWRWQRYRPRLYGSHLKAFSFSRESFDEFSIALRIADRIRRDPPDVIHVHFAAQAAKIARHVGLLTGIPTTFCVHHYDLVLTPPDNFAVLGSDALRMFTISKYNRREMTAVHGLRYDKIEIIHCGIDPDDFPIRPPNHYRTDPQAPLRLLSTGRLTAIKAHRDLVAAA